MYIRWDDADSIKFHISNGVRQGGILSPIFFNIYIKNLFLDNFTASNLGCHFAGIFMSAFAYADDIELLVPSLSALLKMIRLCEIYASDHFFYHLIHLKLSACTFLQGVLTALCLNSTSCSVVNPFVLLIATVTLLSGLTLCLMTTLTSAL